MKKFNKGDRNIYSKISRAINEEIREETCEVISEVICKKICKETKTCKTCKEGCEEAETCKTCKKIREAICEATRKVNYINISKKIRQW